MHRSILIFIKKAMIDFNIFTFFLYYNFQYFHFFNICKKYLTCILLWVCITVWRNHVFFWTYRCTVPGMIWIQFWSVGTYFETILLHIFHQYSSMYCYSGHLFELSHHNYVKIKIFLVLLFKCIVIAGINYCHYSIKTLNHNLILWLHYFLLGSELCLGYSAW